MAPLRSILLLVASLSVMLSGTDVAAAEPEYVVIVHASNPIESVTRATVADYFLKRRTRWPSGKRVDPVDQRRGTATRRSFSDAVLRRSVQAIQNHWQQQIFTGRGYPPRQLGSDASVLRYVSTHPDAIGYVAPRAVSAGVRIIRVR